MTHNKTIKVTTQDGDTFDQKLEVLDIDSLDKAYNTSAYTILGAGGELKDWMDGYCDLLKQAGIGRPEKWYSTTGKDVNAYALKKHERLVDATDMFQDHLSVLMFSHEGLSTGALAMFKLQFQDRWFDDVIDNMRSRG